MSTAITEQKVICPFWNEQSMKCSVQHMGLFIPLEDHVAVYCCTHNYPQCLQYVHQMSSEIAIAAKDSSKTKDRRKFLRIELQHDITLTEAEKEKKGTIASAKAKTLDLSMGGMRLSTEKPLRNDSIIQFSFDDALFEHPLTGIGHIAWCIKSADSPGYQAGIVFEEQHFVQRIGTYLNSVST